MLFNSHKTTSMATEIFEQAEVLKNLLETHISDDNYIFPAGGFRQRDFAAGR